MKDRASQSATVNVWIRMVILPEKTSRQPNHRIEQRIDYICKEGWNTYKPHKAIFGFRYIQIITDIEITENDFTAIAVYSDMQQTGKFECGHSGINQLFSNALMEHEGEFS